MKNTQPIFIVSSGRSGSASLATLLSKYHDIESHHEYLCTHTQPIAVKLHAGIIDNSDAAKQLTALHLESVKRCEKQIWLDSSNKLSWLIPPLEEIFNNAKYIHLIRDGRKVVSSYYHKLSDEAYDDKSIEQLLAYIKYPEHTTPPPPEKKYWWPTPPPESKAWESFIKFDRFERLCFHWAELHRQVLYDLKKVPAHRQLEIKLEDLVSSPENQVKLCDFMSIPHDEGAFSFLAKPHNVNKPVDHPLTAQQTLKFQSIAGDIHRHFGYTSKEEYRVIY